MNPSTALASAPSRAAAMHRILRQAEPLRRKCGHVLERETFGHREAHGDASSLPRADRGRATARHPDRTRRSRPAPTGPPRESAPEPEDPAIRDHLVRDEAVGHRAEGGAGRQDDALHAGVPARSTASRGGGRVTRPHSGVLALGTPVRRVEKVLQQHGRGERIHLLLPSARASALLPDQGEGAGRAHPLVPQLHGQPGPRGDALRKRPRRGGALLFVALRRQAAAQRPRRPAGAWPRARETCAWENASPPGASASRAGRRASATRRRGRGRSGFPPSRGR